MYVPRKRGWVAQDGKGIKGTTLARKIAEGLSAHVLKLSQGKNLTVGALKKKLYARADSSEAVKFGWE